MALKKNYKLFKYFEIFVAIVIATAVLMTAANYFFYKKNFSYKIQKQQKYSAGLIKKELNKTVFYVENLSGFVAKIIVKQKNRDAKSITQILEDNTPKTDKIHYNIFAWTFFNFVNSENYLITTSALGKIEKPRLVTKEKRSWIVDSRRSPWKLQFNKKDMGMVSREPILPVGFGITDKNNKFIGVLSIGLNTYKLTSLLQSSLEDKLSSFALIGKGNEILLNSQNFGDDSLKDIEKYLAKYEGKLKNGFFKVNGQTYYLEDSAEYPFHILAGTDENLTRKEFWSSFFPKITNTVYITIFFLILLYFFRQKLLKPVVKLANATNQISNNKLDALVPTSEIYEVSLLSDSILTLKRFLQKEEGLKRQLKIDKEKAQQENISKNDFLSATAHDLKNLIAGIMGMAELIRFNLNTKPKTNEIKFTREEFEENMEHLNDIDKCSNELLDFIHDLLDINQASTGDFKIIEEEEVDLTNLTRRSIAMLSTRANKSQQSLVYNISKNSKSLIAHNLDSRRVKQILVNLISNAIKYSKKNTKIEISIATLDIEKEELEDLIANIRKVNLGGQDCHSEEKGAFTGDTSAKMLQDAGCKYVILGHSERRCNHNENSSLIALKIASAVKQNLIPILCVGEDKSHRDSGKYAEFIKEQLKSSIPENLEIDNLIIAYEPIWSIGTGILPQISEIEEISRLIKEFVQNSKNINNFKVIYGGSVKKDNSSEVLSGNNIDGLLVGGASLDANEFFDICFNT